MVNNIMSDQQANVNTQLEEIQHTRAFLRERFLRLISRLSGGEKCQLKLHENHDHTCNVRAFHPNFETVIVESLQTNYPNPIPKAIIRTNDIISMHFENVNL
ncbi:hypothetical protein ILUMI_01968 [Ignelater luminosus]|uniref:Uncharacterized protein n=1 Tax=Ignelater luminosus TaxID=2038154 RepID=A0A8K0DJ51_IGNLU|nr:hypothetical protein ILUMI_01968 [Ignelater luminosus]